MEWAVKREGSKGFEKTGWVYIINGFYPKKLRFYAEGNEIQYHFYFLFFGGS